MALYLSCAAVFLRDRIFVTPLNPEAIAVAVEEVMTAQVAVGGEFGLVQVFGGRFG